MRSNDGFRATKSRRQDKKTPAIPMNVLMYHVKTVPRWLLLFSLLPLSTCSPQLDALQKAQLLGRLVVATTNSPTTCYDGPQGLTGFECDVLQGLAKKLKVAMSPIPPHMFQFCAELSRPLRYLAPWTSAASSITGIS